MNLNNAKAAQAKPANQFRWQGWLSALGFALLFSAGVAHSASDNLPEKSYTMAPAAPERLTAQQAFA